MDHLVQSGLMTKEEKEIYESTSAEIVRWHIPLEWAKKIVAKHAEENPLLIQSPVFVSFFSKLDHYRLCFRKLFCYDWVCIPLVYTQIAAIATYSYLAFCLISRQFLIPEKKIPGYEVDCYVPVVTIVEFLFYVGWFKVGQDLMRPFGKDDDDIELNYILDRHIQASFAMVNEVSAQEPPIFKDKIWNLLNPPNPPDLTQQDPQIRVVRESLGVVQIPHTKSSAKLKDNPPILHSNVRFKRPEDAEILELDTINLAEQKPKKRRRISELAEGERPSSALVMANLKILGYAEKWRSETKKRKNKFRPF